MGFKMLLEINVFVRAGITRITRLTVFPWNVRGAWTSWVRARPPQGEQPAGRASP